jgi:hypothetical protein
MQAPTGFYKVRCVYSGQEANYSPYNFTLSSDDVESYTFVFGDTPPPSSAYVFEDSFDSADFSKWDGVRTSSGEVLKVVDSFADQSGYCVQFASNGRSGVEYAYCYKTVDMNEVWAYGNFYISWGLPLENDGDRVYFMRFLSGQDYVAGVGIRRFNGSDRWVLYGKDGSNSAPLIYSSLPVLEMKQWYRVVLHWKKDSTLGVLEAFVNNERALTMENIDTAEFGNVTQINFGMMSSMEQGKRVTIYGDSFSFYKQLVWDLNQDKKTDVIDISIAAKAYRSTPDSPNWNPKVDLDKNGKIDIIDLATVARHYGENYT